DTGPFRRRATGPHERPWHRDLLRRDRRGRVRHRPPGRRWPAGPRRLQPGRAARRVRRGGGRAGQPPPRAPAAAAGAPAAGLGVADLDGVAYTAGPGLVGALLVGAGLDRSLAWALDVPAIGVHHMEGHLLAPLLEDPGLAPPFVALLVSGGHTQLVAVDGIGAYRLLGETLDDAAGEAFDKTAKLMGLPYPGGPQLAALAETGRPGAFRFSRPMTDRPGLDFSFSGLKTQVLLAWRDSDQSDATRADIARGFEDAVVDTLAIKCERALDAAGCGTLV